MPTTTRSWWRTAPTTVRREDGCSPRWSSRTGRPSSSTGASWASTAPARSIRRRRRRATVVVEGVLLESERRGRFGPTDPDDGALEVLARVDLERVAQQVDYDVLPAYLQRTSSDPEEATPPGDPELVALGLPEPIRGSPPRLRGPSGSSSRPSRWSATRCCCDGSRATRRRRRRHERRTLALDRELQALLDAEPDA